MSTHTQVLRLYLNSILSPEMLEAAVAYFQKPGKTPAGHVHHFANAPLTLGLGKEESFLELR